MELNELMSGFAAEIGLGEISANDTGAYWLRIDDFSVAFTADEAGRTLVVYTTIGERDEVRAGGLADFLLELNNLYVGSFGGTIALDREAGQYAYQRRVSLFDLDKDSFRALVEDFVNRAETLQDLIGKFFQTHAVAETAVETVPETGGEAPVAEELLLGGLTSGFMQV